MNKLKDICKLYMDLLLIGLSVTLLWQLLELIIMGSIEYRKVDSVISKILTMSIYLNIDNFRNRRK